MVDFYAGFEDNAFEPLRALAGDLGFRYVDTPDRIYREQMPEKEFPWHLPLLSQGDPGDLHDLLYGTFGALPAQAFNLDLMTYREDTSQPRRSCALFTLPADFPLLTVSPHTRLSLVQSRDRSAFGNKYRVLGRDPEVERLVLDDGMRAWLLEASPGVSFELSGNALLGHVAQGDAAVFSRLLQDLYAFYIRIPEMAWSRFGTGDAVGGLTF